MQAVGNGTGPQDEERNRRIVKVLQKHRSEESQLLENIDPLTEFQRLVPDEESLSKLQSLRAEQHGIIAECKTKVANLEAELIREQDPEHMRTAQFLIGGLLEEVNEIKEKAAEAEAIVSTITRDIQRLDTAKKNMTAAITALRRWSMLQEAYTELKDSLRKKQFKPMANSVAAVNGLSTALQALTANPPVAQLFREIQQIQAQVKETVGVELDKFLIEDPNKPADLATIKDVNMVVHALGSDFESHIIERFVNTELREYRRIFGSSSEAGQLDNTARRYAWFRRVLRHHDEDHAGLFPSSWQVDRVLTAKFADGTRQDLQANINKPGESPSVSTLLDAWQATLDWEDQMSKRFDRPFAEIVDKLPISGTSGETVSSVFKESMKIFVDAQDKALEDMLSAYRGPRSRPSMEGLDMGEQPASVLPSSTELFYFYAQILEQCRKYSTGKGMKDLAAVFSKWLKIYSEDVLIASMKKPSSRKSVDGRPNVQEIQTACLVLNTADYCLTTSTQLEEKLTMVIDEEFREQVTFQAERDLFLGVLSACLMTILRELELACEPAFSTITKTAWSQVENVSGRSPYVSDLVGTIKQVAEIVKEKVDQKKYTKSFADKAVGVVIQRYTAAVVRSRPLRKIGAEQVLLDASAVKTCLLDIPPEAGSGSNNAYTRLVQKQMGQLETMLKVVLVPENPPEGFVQNYCLLIADKSFSNFQKILDLKGTSRAEQKKLVDIFLSVTSSNPDLSDTSFLTHLDMDPGQNQSAAVTTMTSRTSADPKSPIAGTANVGLPRSETPKAFEDFKKLVSFALHGQLST